VRARSKQVAVTALISGFTASMRSMQASSSSTGEMALLPMSRRSSTAESSTKGPLEVVFARVMLQVSLLVWRLWMGSGKRPGVRPGPGHAAHGNGFGLARRPGRVSLP